MTVNTLQRGILKVRVFTGFSPFAFRYSNGKDTNPGATKGDDIVGFDIDILRSFAAAHDLELVLFPTGHFDNIWFSPGDGEVDLAAAGIARFKERERPDTAWSEPYFDVVRSILVARHRAALLPSIAEFENATIAFVGGSAADIDTRARAPASARLLPIEDQAEGMALLLAGTIDGLAMGAPSNAYNRKSDPDFTLVDVHKMPVSEGLRFPVAAHNSQLLAALNSFIEDAKATGEIDRYIDTWDMHNAAV